MIKCVTLLNKFRINKNFNQTTIMNNQTREEAIKRCNNLEKELNELKKTLNQPINIMDRIKSFDDVCNYIGINSYIFETRLVQVGLDESSIAFEKLKLIVKVMNEGWTPDWSDSSQYKYYPWFKMNNGSSGVGFSCFVYDYQDSVSFVASCLCFKSKELAIYAGKQFIDIYKNYMIN